MESYAMVDGPPRDTDGNLDWLGDGTTQLQGRAIILPAERSIGGMGDDPHHLACTACQAQQPSALSPAKDDPRG